MARLSSISRRFWRVVFAAAFGAGAAGGDALKNADDSWKYRNHLVGETSPYLLLHAHNPVEWYPWGDEALARAKAEDKPIFLSVGYSTCHWCHVMERLVFSDPEIAAQMNASFINIKVDREERPDIDRIYMLATQLTTQHGGWPNSVFLTPDQEPFFAGTYFPPEPLPGRPSFPQVLDFARQRWQDQREQVLQIAARLTAAIRDLESGQQTAAVPPDSLLVARVLAAVQTRYDAIHGGFGGAPKFPPSLRLEMLMATAERFADPQVQRIVLHSLEQMAAGGMYDQIGGGFHRYATDAEWRVPHFEKMLYNQAQLARLYLRAYELTRDDRWRWVAEDIFHFVAQEMTGPEGAFYSALDAETEGEEGKYYLWTAAELESALGDEAEFFWSVYGLAPMPAGEGGVLYAKTPVAEAERRDRLAAVRQRVLAARAERLYPLLDDKVLAAWNGMMIEAYARGFAVLGDPAYRRAAERAADFALQYLRREDGGLWRVHRLGISQQAAYLDDYAFLARGLTALYRATGEARWLQAARELSAEMVARFWDTERGGFFFTEASNALIVRSKFAQDSALPSGNAVAAHALLDLAELTGQAHYRRRAAQVLSAFGGAMWAQPAASVHLTAAVERHLQASLSAVAPADIQADSLVSMRVELPAQQPVAGEAFAVAVYLDIRPGWHINANPPSGDLLILTSLTLNADWPLDLARVRYPTGRSRAFPALAETLSVYENEVELSADLSLPPTAAGTAGYLRFLVQYQACDDTRCLPPAELSQSVLVAVAP